MRVQSFQKVAVYTALVVDSRADLFDQRNGGLARDDARVPANVNAQTAYSPFTLDLGDQRDDHSRGGFVRTHPLSLGERAILFGFF
jgi:hypothetical protein